MAAEIIPPEVVVARCTAGWPGIVLGCVLGLALIALGVWLGVWLFARELFGKRRI